MGADVIHRKEPAGGEAALDADGPLVGEGVEELRLVADQRAGGEVLVQVGAIARAHVEAAQRDPGAGRKGRQRSGSDAGGEADLPEAGAVIEDARGPGEGPVRGRVIDDLRVVDTVSAADDGLSVVVNGCRQSRGAGRNPCGSRRRSAARNASRG